MSFDALDVEEVDYEGFDLQLPHVVDCLELIGF